MNALLRPLVAILVVTAAPILAAEGKTPNWQGTIPCKGKHTHQALVAMAKVSEEAARKGALAALPGKETDKAVTEAELEVENGYLIWSVDVKLTGQEGIEEVLVDAGSGKILAREHESAQAEAREGGGEQIGAAQPAALVVRSIALPGAPEGGVFMDYLAYDRAHHRVWVPAGNTASVDVIDATNGQVSRVEGFPTKEMTRNDGTKRTLGPSSATVGDGVVYVGNRGDSSVCAVNADSLKRGPCLKLDSMPDGLAYVASTKEVWATTPRDASIVIIDASNAEALTLKTKISLEGAPEGYAVDNGRGVFYTNLEDKDRTLTIDLKTRQVTKTWLPACGEDGPKGLALDLDANFLVVACKDRVMVFDAGHDGKRLSALDVGDGIDNIDYVGSRHELYVAAGRAAKLVVARLDAKGGLTAVATAVTAAGARNAVATDQGAAYLTDSREGKILVVAPPASR